MVKLIMFTFSLLCFATSTIADASEYPQEVTRIAPSESTYLSPENSLRSLFSALYVCDLSWANSALTNDTLEKSIRDFNTLEVSRSKMCELEQNIQTSYILARIEHQEAIILLVEGHGFDGTIEVIPHTFILENGLWKLTNKFSNDDVVLDLLYYAPPSLRWQRPKTHRHQSLSWLRATNPGQHQPATGRNRIQTPYLLWKKHRSEDIHSNTQQAGHQRVLYTVAL
jgi:hypothetical protein